MKLTFLGTGTSQGVPVIGCRCRVCRSTDARDKRLRTSAMITVGDKRFIIDAGPDFRQQLLRAEVSHVSAILLTHEHKDHMGGLDDVRALNFVDYPAAIHTVDIYASAHVTECMRKDFDYAFSADKYIGVPEIVPHIIDHEPFSVAGIEIIPVRGHHSERFEVRGYRIGKVAYLTDFSAIESAEEVLLAGVDTLVVNALRFEPHHSHFNVGQALELIERVQPRVAYLTHMSHDIGLYAQTEPMLPSGVHLAYDGLEIEIED